MQIINPATGHDVSDLVRDILVQRLREKLHRAAERQRRLAGNLEDRPNSLIGNIGLQVDPVIYHHWIAREGPECWGDAGFRKDLLRDNPELRPRVARPTNRISLAGIDSVPRKVRESITYPHR